MRTLTLLSIFCLLTLSSASAWSQPSSGHALTSIQATDLSGQTKTVPAPGAKATVLLFVSTTCPYSNAASPAMAKIADAYASKGFAFYFVYGNPSGKLAETKAHAQSYDFDQPAILDTKQTLVRATGATNTPEAVVVSPSGALLYRGRIDNRFSNANSTPTTHDLADALDAIAVGKTPPHSFEQPVGCGIPGAGQAPG